MKIHRFIIKDLLFTEALQITDREIIHQARTVLKLRVGEVIAMCDGKGQEAEGTIMALAIDGINVALGAPHAVVAEPRVRVTLYAALVKRDNFELIVQKAVEVGATRIVPLITHRTIKTGIQALRLHTIMKEAAEQSGRGIVPELDEPTEFGAALTELPRDTQSFFCNNGGIGAHEVQLRAQSDRAIFIGPEGGWDEQEVAAAAEAGLQTISFGSLTLRAETAAIVATHWAVNT